jgi:tetratricopeptide (TPR) repeat protein
MNLGIYSGLTRLLAGLLMMFFVSRMVEAGDIKDFIGEGIPGISEQNYKYAISRLNEKIQINPTNPVPRFDKVRIYLQVGKYDEALADSNKLIQESPNPLGFALRGCAYFGKGDYDKAIADFSECIRIKPIAALYIVRASAYEIKMDFESALNDYSQAILLNTNDAPIYFLRAKIFALKGDFDKAIADYDQVIRITPDCAPAYSNRGLAWSRKGDYKKAIADCNRSLLVDKSAGAYNNYNNLAWILATAPDEKLRDGKRALPNAKRACELSGWKDPYCMGTLAAAYAETGNFQEAIRWEAKCIESGLPDKDLKQAHELLDLYLQKKPYHAGQSKAK